MLGLESRANLRVHAGSTAMKCSLFRGQGYGTILVLSVWSELSLSVCRLDGYWGGVDLGSSTVSLRALVSVDSGQWKMASLWYHSITEALSLRYFPCQHQFI